MHGHNRLSKETKAKVLMLGFEPTTSQLGWEILPTGLSSRDLLVFAVLSGYNRPYLVYQYGCAHAYAIMGGYERL